MMPSEAESVLDKVDYGGMFLAQRPMLPPALPLKVEGDLSGTPAGFSLSHGVSAMWRLEVPNEEVDEPPKVSDGWQVKSYDIVRTRVEEGVADGTVLERRLNELAKVGHMSRRLIENLLFKHLPDSTLGDGDSCLANSSPSSTRFTKSPTNTSFPESLSQSTILFGRSYADLTQIPADPAPDPFYDFSPPPRCNELVERKDNLSSSSCPGSPQPFLLSSANSKILRRRTESSASLSSLNLDQESGTQP
jgi:hypothetical protein